MLWWIFVKLAQDDPWVEGLRGCSRFCDPRSSGVKRGRFRKFFKTLLRLQILTDFDETWVEASLGRASFRVFRNFWSEVIQGVIGVKKGQITKKMIKNQYLTIGRCWNDGSCIDWLIKIYRTYFGTLDPQRSKFTGQRSNYLKNNKR